MFSIEKYMNRIKILCTGSHKLYFRLLVKMHKRAFLIVLSDFFKLLNFGTVYDGHNLYRLYINQL